MNNPEAALGYKQLQKAVRHILICEGKECTSDGADKTAKHIRHELRRLDLDEEVLCSRMSCAGLCSDGPIVAVYPDGVWYADISAKTGEKIVREHIAEGRHLPKYCVAVIGKPPLGTTE